MTKGKKVKIEAAKGRPMLSWVGKQPLRYVTAFPAQHIESYGEEEKKNWKDRPKGYPQGGLLFHGDNKEVLAHLLANGFRGKVDLIYIDPPFDSGADYVRRVELKGIKGISKIGGEDYTLGEQIQYKDIWANDNYLQFMFERLLLLKEFLTESGSIFIHVDEHKGHFLRNLMDEVFGPNNFVNEIVWYYPDNFQGNVKGFANNHNTIYWYANGSQYIANKVLIQLKKPVKRDRRKWSKKEQKLVAERDEDGKLIYDEYTHKKADDVWSIGQTSVTKSQSLEYEGYPTQKPEEVLRRIIFAASNQNALVLDCFIGSGTTAAVAQKLGRRWIGCDINKGAIQTTSKRLAEIIEEQEENGKQPELMADEENVSPAQLSFSVYRVNDYDLQIQHNEAVELACEHIGIQRTRNDPFFDGTHGKKLAKITPFNHPLSPLDLEEIKRELGARPEEERDITVVCLGKEIATDAWLEDWNILRKKGDVPNKIEVIELRTDPKYGKFFIHEPAKAKVSIKRTKENIKVLIKDFISPSIIERLKSQAGLLSPQIEDWRSMVDTVMIDSAYDGKVLNVILADVPERKNDLVVGEYELDAPEGETTVAVKITDMLGEEVLVLSKV